MPILVPVPMQVDAAEKERVRQVDNLKQQSTHFLEQKSQEILSLKSQLTQMRTQHELEVRRNTGLSVLLCYEHSKRKEISSAAKNLAGLKTRLRSKSARILS